jgi:hypothetical protein
MMSGDPKLDLTLAVLFLSAALPGCGPASPDQATGSSSRARNACPAVFSRFPVDGPHNISIDDTYCNPGHTYCYPYCPPEAQAAANDRFHDGSAQDIFADKGTQVVAAQDGITSVGFSDSLGGNVVYIQDECGWYHYYAHLDTIDPTVYNGGVVGLEVSAGQKLGTVGNTGSAAGTSPHVHYALFDDGWIGGNPYSGLTSVEWLSCTYDFPDLAPTPIATLGRLVPGDVVTFDTGVSNNGNTANGILVGVGSHESIPPHSTVIDDNSAYLWNVEPGTHTVRFVIDGDRQVMETDETNNMVEITVTVSNGGDLFPTAITKNLSVIGIGKRVVFDSGVTNDGPTDSGAFNVRWSVDGVQVGAGGHESVPANSTLMGGNSLYVWTAVAGTHTIRFEVDSDNMVMERNESNNAAEITVTAVELADLLPTPITYTPSLIRAGDMVTFDSGVTNAGNADVYFFDVKWYVDGVLVGYGGHSGVPAKSTVMDGNSSYLWHAVEGTHTVRFVVDPENYVPEEDEENNATETSVTVSPSKSARCTSDFQPAYSGSPAPCRWTSVE